MSSNKFLYWFKTAQDERGKASSGSFTSVSIPKQRVSATRHDLLADLYRCWNLSGIGAGISEDGCRQEICEALEGKG